MNRRTRQRFFIWLYISILSLFMSARLINAEDVDTAWFRQYNGPSNKSDFAKSVAIDEFNNVIITGQSQGYWPNQPYSDNDIVTIKYNSDGDTLWLRRFDPEDTLQEQGKLIRVSKNGNLYIAGTSSIPSVFSKMIIIKYNAGGDTIWTRNYSNAIPIDMVVDTGGKVWVTAEIYDGSQYDWLTVCYNASGTLLWFNQTGTSGFVDQPNAIVLDTVGNVYVTGVSYNGSSGTDMLTVKYNQSGNTVWSKRISGITNAGGVDIALDNNQNIIVGGFRQLAFNENELILVKYNTVGDTSWLRNFHGAGNGPDVAGKVGVDDSSNVYFTGIVYNTPTVTSLILLKYNDMGTNAFTKYFSPLSSISDMVVNNNGDVYITGIGMLSLYMWDWGTVKFFSTGDTAWFRWLLGGVYPALGEAPEDMAMDNSGAIIVTGYVTNGPVGQVQDYGTVKYVMSCCSMRGNIDGLGVIDIADLVYFVDYSFSQPPGPPPPCQDEADVDGSGTIDIADIVYMVDYMFSQPPGPAPVACP